MEKKFSFVKHLTNRDIEKILAEVGLELDNERCDRNGNALRPVSRGTGDDGRGYVIAFCIDKNQREMDSEISKYMYENSPAFRKLANTLSIFSAMAGFGGSNPYMQNDKVILRIDDFTMTECMSLKSEKDEYDFDLKMTKVYQKYMAEKFGRFYYNMKAGRVRSLNREEAKKEQEKETPENEVETEKQF